MHPPPFLTLPHAADYATAKAAAALLRNRTVLAVVIGELERAFTKSEQTHITLHGTLPEADKDTLCEQGYVLYEEQGHVYEHTHITWSSAHVCEGDLYISRRSAGRLLGLALEQPASEDASSPEPQAPSLPNDGGAVFQALALLAFTGLLMFGLLTVTLDHLARATLAVQTAVTHMPTLTFGAWLVAIALGWGVTVALAWLVGSTCEHERHLNLKKRMTRPKAAPQGEHRFNKYTLTPADAPALKHS
jgi:hypothetical protein